MPTRRRTRPFCATTRRTPPRTKPDQLLPVAVCYLSFGDIPKSKAAFESFLKTSPKNIRALRTLGTISLLSKDFDTAMRYYKTAIAAGDEKSNVFLGSAYIMANKADEVKPLLPVLEKLAKTNLEALNVVMFYAGRDRKNFDRELVQKVLADVDARSVLESATPDGMSTVLRLYLATRDMWPVSALAVPAARRLSPSFGLSRCPRTKRFSPPSRTTGSPCAEWAW